MIVRPIAVPLPASFAAAWLVLAPLAASAGPLEDKAIAYSRNFQEVHAPAFGCSLEVRFASPESTTVLSYEDAGDSTIWTGNYLAAESYRYAVTQDPEAKAFGTRAAECLLAMEEVTGKPGFIARFVGPAVPPFLNGPCEGDCHVVAAGPYAGTFWLGNTVPDQFLGWWYGLAHAYDFLLTDPDDEPLRQRIRAAMGRVVDTIVADDYLIVDPDGTVSTAGPGINGHEALAMHYVAAHAVGGVYEDLADVARTEKLGEYLIGTLYPISRWYEYFAFHLGHMAQHMTIRYEAAPLWRPLHRGMLRERLTKHVIGTQQVMFDYIAVGEGAAEADPALLESDRAALAGFPLPPKRRLQPVQGPWTPDPFVDQLNEVIAFLEELLGIGIGRARTQALDPFPVEERCLTGFRWQSPPYELCGGSDAAFEYPGPDYLVAYWMGRWYGFLDEQD